MLVSTPRSTPISSPRAMRSRAACCRRIRSDDIPLAIGSPALWSVMAM
jgi:hypothetical protein